LSYKIQISYVFVCIGNERVALLLLEKGADIHKSFHKTDGSPFEGAIKKKLPKVRYE